MVNDAIVRMLRSGDSDAVIGQKLASTYGVIPKGKSSRPANRPAYRPDSSPTSSTFSLPVPQILYDSCGHDWYAYAHYDWKSMSAIKSDAGLCGDEEDVTCNVGGYDGFGITFSRAIADPEDYFMQTWGTTSHYPTSTSRTWVEDGGAYGATFIGQDKWCYYVGKLPCTTNICSGNCVHPQDYSFYHGELFYDMNSIGCGSLKAYSKYLHTWSSTSIDGFSVGPYSFGIQWASSGHDWPLGSQPSSTVTPC
jgi:hypothetical protein